MKIATSFTLFSSQGRDFLVLPPNHELDQWEKNVTPKGIGQGTGG